MSVFFSPYIVVLSVESVVWGLGRGDVCSLSDFALRACVFLLGLFVAFSFSHGFDQNSFSVVATFLFTPVFH